MTWTALVALCFAAGCAAPSESGDPPQPPASVVLSSVSPTVVVPGTHLMLTGSNMVSNVNHVLHLSGVGSQGKQVELELNVAYLTPAVSEVMVNEQTVATVGDGAFQGEAWVVSSNVIGHTVGHKLPVTLEFRKHLQPSIRDVGQGLVFLNSHVKVLGDNILLGNGEGRTTVEIVGCYLPAGENGTNGCSSGSGQTIAAKVSLVPDQQDDRARGFFEFRPSIVGLSPGKLTGTVELVNSHSDGTETRSKPLSATFQLESTRIHRLDQQDVSLGQFLDIRGAGFVGDDQNEAGGTLVHFTGSFTPAGGKPRQVTFDLVPGYRHGGWVRYVLEEGIGIGKTVKVRTETGTLDGTWTPTVYWGGESQEGPPIKLTMIVAPVKQLVWVRFGGAWQEGLRLFGLQAADTQIRHRILEVVRRDYAGINVEVREDEPQDFKLYAKVDLNGKDPNGLGLLGYDNTPGKDVENQRLYDWLGGVNAVTQQDGYPGYGGVFLESMLGFSEHPPKGVFKSPLKSNLFDQLFDPFRPDRGGVELTTAEALAVGVPSSTSGCPDSSDRMEQARCAIRVLGNVVGSTVAHELGHSLGLADPYGPPKAFHNPGDLPNRLMEAGQGRPFEERAELNGKGPAVFCDEEYLYLKSILPLDPPQDPATQRPGCY